MELISRSSRKSISSLLLAFLALVMVGNCCISLNGQNREIIDARQILNQQSNIVSCLQQGLKNGRINFVKSIIDLYDTQCEDKLIKIFQQQMKRLKIIQQQIVLTQSNCEPVVKWGQNLTHLFITMKMSHRWDSPPCLNTKQERANLVNNSFEYINLCLVSQSLITFTFQVEFYENVKTNDIIVTKDGVGTYSSIIQKEIERVWPYLGKNEKIYQIWGEISERHNSIHHQYEKLLQDSQRQKRSKPIIEDLNNNIIEMQQQIKNNAEGQKIQLENKQIQLETSVQEEL